jgi:transcriptional regulator with XRE-family HTH domain
MSPADFARWRELMGINRTQAAEVLGISRNMPAKYEAGTSEISQTVALACAALLRGIAPWPG